MILLLFILFSVSLPQNLSIQNYSTNDYKSNKQNWAIAESDGGLLFIANHSSLIEYDGSSWRNYQIPNYTVRSLFYDKTYKKLYVGGVNEFGYFAADSVGVFKYHSLTSKIKNSNQFREIWKIYKIKDSIFYCGFNFIFELRVDNTTNHVEVYKLSERALYTFKYRDSLYTQTLKNGLSLYEKGKLVDLSWGKFFRDKYIMFIKNFRNKMVIGTYSNGVYTVEKDMVREFTLISGLTNDKVSNATFSENYIIITTMNNGVFIYDVKDKSSKRYNISNGLIDNSIHGVHLTKNDELWLTLNNGIANIKLLNPFKKIRLYLDKDITIYDILKKNNELLIGTNKGFYSYNDDKMILLKDIGTVKKISFFANKILVTSSAGLFSYHKNRLYKINDLVFSYLKKSTLKENILYAHSESNRALYKIKSINDNLSFKLIKTFDARVVNIVDVDSDNVLIGTSNNGLLKLTGNKTLTKERFNDDESIQVQIFNVHGNIVVAPYYGVYRYNKGEYTKWSVLQTDKNVAKIQEINRNDFWFRKNYQYNIASKQNDGSYRITSKIFKTLPQSTNLVIYPDPEKEGITWFGEQGQLIRYDANVKVDVDASFPTYVRKITLDGDSVLFGGHHPKGKKLTFDIEYTTAPLRFEFAAPFYTRPEKTTYSYKLEGFDEDWSNWSSETTKDYTGLYEGDYTFMVKAKNVYETISSTDTYTFTINPPIYRTYYAYGMYLLGFGWFIFSFIRYSAHKKTLRLQELHRIEIAENKTRELELHNKIEKQEMRTRIASDLHDEVGSNLNGIGLVSNLMLKQLNLDEKNQKRLNQIKEVALESAESMRDIVWFVNPENDTFEKTLEKIQYEGNRLLGHLDYSFSLNKESEYSEPNIDIRRNLYMFFKETVQNIVKHSDATKVDIALKVTEKSIYLMVNDNGIGFDLEAKSTGNGLRNFHKRAEKIGGKATIFSKPTKGCKIELFVEF